MLKDLKTPLQGYIEIRTAKGRGYHKVPYTRLFGERKALDQWLFFANNRVICFDHLHSKRTHVLKSIRFYYEKKFNEIKDFLHYLTSEKNLDNFVEDVRS